LEHCVRSKIATIALTFLAATAIACGAGSSDTAGPGSQDDGTEAKSGDKTIVLEVTGAKAGADITYGLGTDQSQEQGAKVPWKKELTSSESLIIATVVAQNKGSGEIKCKITIDGEVVKENKSSGEFAVVTCNN
jgi:hypothetical protein